MKKRIRTYEVPVTITEAGGIELEENNRKLLPDLDEEITIEKPADITRLAVDISQENSRVAEVAINFVPRGTKSTIKRKYIE